MQNENALKAAITNSPDWPTAVEDFVRCSIQLGQPFTSGHITTILRVYRPELRFKHGDIGEKCRDMFYEGEADYGSGAVQEPRVCAGLGRTPAGTTVFVYAGDQEAALDFPFELDIPEAGSKLTQMPSEHPIQTNVQVQPHPPSPADMRATVHSDHRLCVPRAALEALLHATSRTFRADQRVWVRFEGTPDYDKAIITLDQQPGAVDYGVQATGGRILFVKAGSGRFNHGDVFAVQIVNDEIVADISVPLDE